jgi:threonine/homoserine/homoserine lactone efflux protein
MFAGILGWTLFFCWAVAKLGQRVRGFQRYVAYASALVLAAFAAWVAWRGAGLLGLAG